MSATRHRTIPEIRERLMQLADEHNLPELRELAEETKRRAPCRVAPRRSLGITDEVRERVRQYAEDHPKAHMRAIGAVFKIDQGRVSEILHGKRGEQ